MITNVLTSTIRRLFLYDDWANREVLASLRRAADPPARARTLLGHIIGAGEIWHERLIGRGRSVVVWPDFSLDECEARLDVLRDDWAAFFGDMPDEQLLESVEYTNSAGDHFTNTKMDILTHVVTHSGYHRGQIALLLGSSGLASANTDFILGVRQGKVDRGPSG